MGKVAGDLEVENFGLNETDFDLLCKEVSIIYHNGARVRATNFINIISD